MEYTNPVNLSKIILFLEDTMLVIKEIWCLMFTSNYHVLFVQISLMVLGVVIFICVLNPMVLLFTLPLIVIFVFVRTFFLKTSRDVKRLEGTSKYGVMYVCCCFLGKKKIIICCPQVGKLGRWVGLNPNLPTPFWGCSVSIWSQSHLWRLKWLCIKASHISLQKECLSFI